MKHEPLFRGSAVALVTPLRGGKVDVEALHRLVEMHVDNGTAAIVCFPGVMYRGGAEKQIRKCLIDNNFIDCIIQLPDNLFYGTTIATCIMVLLRFLQHPYTSNNRTKPDACRMLC